MAIIGRGGLVLLQVVAIDDQCDACLESGGRGICFGAGRAVLCFECIKSAGKVVPVWDEIPGGPPSHQSSGMRRG